MASKDQEKHPGEDHPWEEHHYGQKSQIPDYQNLPDHNYASQPISSYPGQQTTDSVPPVAQNFGNLEPGTKINGSVPKRKNRAALAIVILSLTTLLFLGTTIFAFTRPTSTSTLPTPTATPVALQKPTTAPTTVPTNVTATSVVTPTAPSGQPSNNYAAPQPGPGCDTNGGVWTPQGLGNITCGTQVTPAADGTWGYLYLQLPNNGSFSTNNKITVTGNISSGNSDCVGLAEQDANAGFLVTYCASGAWSISSISNKGIITKSLLSNITATKTSTTLSLAISGSTLVYTIDSETHQVAISPIQPTKVAIAYDINSTCSTCYIPNITTNNFSYITPAN